MPGLVAADGKIRRRIGAHVRDAERRHGQPATRPTMVMRRRPEIAMSYL
jgi:hypothetical protein